MQENILPQAAEKLELWGRKRLSMTGVEAVDGFSEQAINLTVGGVKVRITGEKLKITAYNKATGSLAAEGTVTEIRYQQKSAPIFKRIFK